MLNKSPPKLRGLLSREDGQNLTVEELLEFGLVLFMWLKCQFSYDGSDASYKTVSVLSFNPPTLKCFK